MDEELNGVSLLSSVLVCRVESIRGANERTAACIVGGGGKVDTKVEARELLAERVPVELVQIGHAVACRRLQVLHERAEHHDKAEETGEEENGGRPGHDKVLQVVDHYEAAHFSFFCFPHFFFCVERDIQFENSLYYGHRKKY